MKLRQHLYFLMWAAVLCLLLTAHSIAYPSYPNKLEELRQKYGLSIVLPDSWKETPYGVMIVDKNLLFSFIWHPPTSPFKEEMKQDGKFVISVANIPLINMHLFMCSSHPEKWRKYIQDCCQPVDIRNGERAEEVTFESNGFVGSRAPQFRSPEEHSSPREFLGCQHTTVFLHKNGIIEAGADVLTTHYVIHIRLQATEEHYKTLSKDFSEVLRSIRIRCEDNGAQWCEAKYGVADFFR